MDAIVLPTSKAEEAGRKPAQKCFVATPIKEGARPIVDHTLRLRCNTQFCGTSSLSTSGFSVPEAHFKKTLLLLQNCNATEAADSLAACGTAAAVIAPLTCLPRD